MMSKQVILSGIMLGFAALFFSAGEAVAFQTSKDIAPASVMDSRPFEAVSLKNASDFRVEKFAQRQISASQAKSIAMSRVPGGQYIDLRKSGNTYIVRIRDRNGRVFDIRIDATTGRVK